MPLLIQFHAFFNPVKKAKVKAVHKVWNKDLVLPLMLGWHFWDSSKTSRATRRRHMMVRDPVPEVQFRDEEADTPIVLHPRHPRRKVHAPNCSINKSSPVCFASTFD